MSGEEEEDAEEGAQRRGRWVGAGSAQPWVLWAQRQGWTKTKQKKCIAKKEKEGGMSSPPCQVSRPVGH